MRAKHSKDISINRFAYNGREFEYELERKHVKNINVRIKPERIYVSADYTVPLEYIERFLLSKGDYIFRALEKYNEGKYPPMRGTYEDGDIIYILGQRYVLNLEKGKNGARIEAEKIILSCLSPGEHALRRRIMEKWLRQSCERIFPRVMEAIYPAFEIYGVRFPQIYLRKMKARWGSCRPARGAVTFNTELIHVPEKCMQYVAAHELTHFLQPDHSKRFYEKLEAVMPDWKERRALLEEYGRAVIVK